MRFSGHHDRRGWLCLPPQRGRRYKRNWAENKWQRRYLWRTRRRSITAHAQRVEESQLAPVCTSAASTHGKVFCFPGELDGFLWRASTHVNLCRIGSWDRHSGALNPNLLAGKTLSYPQPFLPPVPPSGHAALTKVLLPLAYILGFVRTVLVLLVLLLYAVLVFPLNALLVRTLYGSSEKDIDEQVATRHLYLLYAVWCHAS
jgi:hypothetical protein